MSGGVRNIQANRDFLKLVELFLQGHGSPDARRIARPTSLAAAMLDPSALLPGDFAGLGNAIVAVRNEAQWRTSEALDEISSQAEHAGSQFWFTVNRRRDNYTGESRDTGKHYALTSLDCMARILALPEVSGQRR